MRVQLIDNDGGGYAEDIVLAEGTTIQQVFDLRVGGNAENYLIRINREPAPKDHILCDGDRISITPTKIDGAS